MNEGRNTSNDYNDAKDTLRDQKIDAGVGKAIKAPFKIAGGVLGLLGIRRMFSGKFAWILLIAIVLIVGFGLDPLGIRSATKGESISDQKQSQIDQINEWAAEGKEARIKANEVSEDDVAKFRSEISEYITSSHDIPLEKRMGSQTAAPSTTTSTPTTTTSPTTTSGIDLDEVLKGTDDWKKGMTTTNPPPSHPTQIPYVPR